jgi:hypothetical protein
VLAIVPLLVVLDSIAAGVDLLEGAFGMNGEPGTISGAAVSNRDALAALDDVSVQNDLTSIFAKRVSLVRAPALYVTLQGGLVQRALDRHYGAEGNGSLNTFLRNQGARVHPNVRLAGMQVDSENVFAPNVVDPVASYNGIGAGTGTFVAGSDIDTTQYGPSALEVVVDAMGIAARTVRLTVKKFDGSAETRDVVVAANAVVGSALPVGAGADRYVGVSNIVTVGGGGTAVDRLRVRSQVERVIAL